MRAALGPQLCTSTGPLATLRWVIGSLLPTPLGKLVARTAAAVLPGAGQAVGSCPVTTGARVRLAHAMGKQVHVWTVDDAAVMRRLLAWASTAS